MPSMAKSDRFSGVRRIRGISRFPPKANGAEPQQPEAGPNAVTCDRLQSDSKVRSGEPKKEPSPALENRPAPLTRMGRTSRQCAGLAHPGSRLAASGQIRDSQDTFQVSGGFHGCPRSSCALDDTQRHEANQEGTVATSRLDTFTRSRPLCADMTSSRSRRKRLLVESYPCRIGTVSHVHNRA